MDNLYTQKIANVNDVFEDRYLSAKGFNCPMYPM